MLEKHLFLLNLQNLVDDFTFDKILCVETLHDQPKP